MYYHREHGLCYQSVKYYWLPVHVCTLAMWMCVCGVNILKNKKIKNTLYLNSPKILHLVTKSLRVIGFGDAQQRFTVSSFIALCCHIIFWGKYVLLKVFAVRYLQRLCALFFT